MDQNYLINETHIDEKIIETDDFSVPDKVEIIGVRFKKSGKVYYFDPCGIKYEVDDNVIVKTARGIEYGTCATANRIVNGTDIVPPLRTVVRKATSTDEERHEANVQSELEAMRICNQKIQEHQLEMKLVDVEYTFDNNKLLFYFTADGRVDFRELVKDLASVFKTRIELRQIGIRDETKLIGGLGVCGRPFCCSSFLSDFSQVSIKMAKEQNLSLNSAKISGACGKLMCCLKYEHDVYLEEIKNTPKVDSIVTTPDGAGTIVESNPLTGICKVELDSDQDNTIHIYHRDLLNKTFYNNKMNSETFDSSQTESASSVTKEKQKQFVENIIDNVPDSNRDNDSKINRRSERKQNHGNETNKTTKSEEISSNEDNKHDNSLSRKNNNHRRRNHKNRQKNRTQKDILSDNDKNSKT